MALFHVICGDLIPTPGSVVIAESADEIRRELEDILLEATLDKIETLVTGKKPGEA